jgi:hypothetical protein
MEVNSPTLAVASSTICRLRLACSAKACPASVGTTPRAARTKRSVPEHLLELADLLGDGRLGHAQSVGRRTERAQLRGGAEATELLE